MAFCSWMRTTRPSLVRKGRTASHFVGGVHRPFAVLMAVQLRRIDPLTAKDVLQRQWTPAPLSMRLMESNTG